MRRDGIMISCCSGMHNIVWEWNRLWSRLQMCTRTSLSRKFVRLVYKPKKLELSFLKGLCQISSEFLVVLFTGHAQCLQGSTTDSSAGCAEPAEVVYSTIKTSSIVFMV